MAGHSHSANIRHRKGRVDEARGKLFSKLAREIISAAREGGGDPEANLRLRYAIDRARKSSMPKDNIERAIKRGSGDGGGAALEELIYEGYASGGVAVLVESLTDNRNRTAPELRKAFEKKGGNMAESGAVAWMFERKSIFILEKEKCSLDEEALMELVLELGAEDFLVQGDSIEITGEPTDFHQIVRGLEERKIEASEAKMAWIPKQSVPVQDKDQARKILQLIEGIEELDDVTEVSANYDIPEEILAELDAEE
ncbi:MAG: YebC/PmpR family DNA-binding transcriptional regulator [Planctomycetota bacterium]|nr:MAG: YebC/PmpR family DNA-binding transcriptional regulator [Planctomycetota bacterium]